MHRAHSKMATKEEPWQYSVQLGIHGLHGSHDFRWPLHASSITSSERSRLHRRRNPSSLWGSLLSLLLLLLSAKRGHLRTYKCRRAAHT